MKKEKVKTGPGPSVVTLRIPKDLKSRLEQAADQQGVSLNQFALYILAGELARFEAAEEQAWQALDHRYPATRPGADVVAEARKLLQRTPAKDVPDWDRID